jgi:hypothetical protein
MKKFTEMQKDDFFIRAEIASVSGKGAITDAELDQKRIDLHQEAFEYYEIDRIGEQTEYLRFYESNHQFENSDSFKAVGIDSKQFFIGEVQFEEDNFKVT